MDLNCEENDQLSVISDNFSQNLTLHESPALVLLSDEEHVSDDHGDGDDDDDEEEDDDEDDDGEFEFSFAGGDASSPVSADEVFCDGKIRPLFPFTDEISPGDDGGTSYRPPVEKVFVVEDGDVAEGPYCAWSSEKSSTEVAAPEMSKKSNSTGFSKLWKVKDLLVRSNSDGRDSFVVLPGKEAAPVKAKKKVSLRKLKIGGETAATATASGDGEEKKRKSKKGKKPTATAATTAYEELYVNKEKKKSGKSYLPYKQDLVGFFTNANGMSRNVHPY